MVTGNCILRLHLVLLAYYLICRKMNPPTHTVIADHRKVFGSARLEQIEVNRYEWLGDLKSLQVSFHKIFSLTVALEEPCEYVGDVGDLVIPAKCRGYKAITGAPMEQMRDLGEDLGYAAGPWGKLARPEDDWG
jgi:hypothetical protein